jgi:pyruvate dehydrogenase E1 component alpha subunit
MIDSNLRIELYERLLRIRVVEDLIAKRYATEQLMRCPVHFSIGEEAVAVAVSANLRPQDQVMSAHRSHAHYLAKGGSLQAMVAELYGKASGATSGRGGSMHLLAKDVGFLGATPIVGSAIPIAAGVAFADAMRHRDRFTIVYFGDGATETGVFHETLNFSAVRHLPIIFVCENNLYSMETDLGVRQPRERPITELAEAHRVPAATFDGQDVETAYEGFASVIRDAIEHRGPWFVEFNTYRFIQHCGPKYDRDDAYRHPGEYVYQQERDPVLLQRRRLSSLGLWNERQDSELRAAVERELSEAIELARASAFPGSHELLRHVYSG